MMKTCETPPHTTHGAMVLQASPRNMMIAQNSSRWHLYSINDKEEYGPDTANIRRRTRGRLARDTPKPSTDRHLPVHLWNGILALSRDATFLDPQVHYAQAWNQGRMCSKREGGRHATWKTRMEDLREKGSQPKRMEGQRAVASRLRADIPQRSVNSQESRHPRPDLTRT